eukprot:jgi/Psemu1/312888/fgenesh1_kg.1049_\
MTENRKDYYLFVHGQEGVGDFDIFVRDENLQDFGTAAPSETPIQHGADLYRWTIVDFGIEIGTDYRSLTIVAPPSGTAKVVGSRIKYTPVPKFSGDDVMTVDGCNGDDCYRFDIVVNIMGDEQDLIIAEGGEISTDNEGWNKLWLLLLLLLFIPCCTCVPLYLLYRKRKQEEENDIDNSESESDESEDEFTDDEEEDGKLLPLKPKSRVVTDSVDSISDEDWESDDDDRNEDSNESSDEENDDGSSIDDDSESNTESADKEFEDFIDEFNR